MIDLEKYFRILFMSTRISKERLKAFCEDHIDRLTNHNPGGIFTTILTNVTNAYNAYYGDMSSELLNLSVKEGKTLAMNEARAALEKQISENEKLISYTYRSNRPFYEEFYPLGILEYTRADLGTFESITDRYKAVLASHAADFPPAFVTDYNTVQGVFVANRSAQVSAFGDVAAERSDLDTTRPALCLQLTTNLLTIALQYVGDESKCDVYFNQSILNAAFRESERKVSGEINPGETQNLFDNITQADVRLLIKNLGEDVLTFGFTTAAYQPVTAFTISPGHEVSQQVGTMGWTTTNKYFNVTNNGGIAGNYSVEKV